MKQDNALTVDHCFERLFVFATDRAIAQAEGSIFALFGLWPTVRLGGRSRRQRGGFGDVQMPSPLRTEAHPAQNRTADIRVETCKGSC